MTDLRRFCEIEGVTIEATLEHVDGSWVAYHAATQASGIGRTEDDALTALTTALTYDRRWFCEGLGRDLLICPEHIARRMVMQGLFCPVGGK